MKPARRLLVWLYTYGGRITLSAFAVALITAIIGSMPNTKLTIEAGAKGGLYDVMATRLANDLEAKGIKVEITNRSDSIHIIDDISSRSNGVDGGFITGENPYGIDNTVSQLGTVMFAPIYLVANKSSGIDSIAGVEGHSLSLYPENSAAWVTCKYILESQGVNLLKSKVSYGNGLAILDDVSVGRSDFGCLLDIPTGSTVTYAGASLGRLSNPNLVYLDIPQGQAIQAGKDYLSSVTIPAGAFSILPRVRPETPISSNAASITFAVRSDFPKDLSVIIADTLRSEYNESTVVNGAGELPSTLHSSLPPVNEAADVYRDGLPWLYRVASYRTAGFIDQFISQYGILLTSLYLLLRFIDHIGFGKPWDLIRSGRPRRLGLIAEAIAYRYRQTGKLTRRDKKMLDTIQKWLTGEDKDIEIIKKHLGHIDEVAKTKG